MFYCAAYGIKLYVVHVMIWWTGISFFGVIWYGIVFSYGMV